MSEEDLDRGDEYEQEVDDISETEEEQEVDDISETEEEQEDGNTVQEKDIKIPKARLDQVIAQRESEKERVSWLEDQLETLINKQEDTSNKPVLDDKEAFNFREAEEQYAELIMEGEASKASSLRESIDFQRKEEFRAMLEEVREDSLKEVNNSSTIAIDKDKFESLVESYEEEYDFLNSSSASYNEEAVNTVNTLISGFQAEGKTKSQSLKEAVSRVVPMYTTEFESNKASVARKKAVNASNSQPPATSNKGIKNIDSDSIVVSSLSDRDFNSLTLKEKKILRGD